MTQASRDRTEYVEISGTAAERTAFDNPKQAMEWYETDTDARYKYMSGAWVNVTLTGGAAPGYGSGGGGGGGAVTIANGADVTQGAKADAAAASDTGTFSLISLVKRLLTKTNPQAAPYTGQQLATNAVVALPNIPLVNGGVVIASTTNAGVIMCGLLGTLTNANDGSGTGYQLNPGQPMPGLAITNLNQLGIILAGGNASASDFICMAGN